MKKIKYRLVLCLLLGASTQAIAAPVAMLFKSGLATALVVLSQPSGAVYCPEMSLRAGQDGCTQYLVCSDGTQVLSGYCPLYTNDGTCIPNADDQSCVLTCDKRFADNSDRTCSQMSVESKNGSIGPAVCEKSFEDQNHGNSDDGSGEYNGHLCWSFESAQCLTDGDTQTSVLGCTLRAFKCVESAGCFYQGMLAQKVEDGEISSIPMGSLQVGDQVVSHFSPLGSAVFTRVRFIPHRDLESIHPFVKVTTQNSTAVLTGEHYLPIVATNGVKRSVQARDLEVGQVLETQFGPVPIVSVVCLSEQARDQQGQFYKGIVHPVTESGKIAVHENEQEPLMVANTHALVDFPNAVYLLYQVREFFLGVQEQPTWIEQMILGAAFFEDANRSDQ